MKINEVCKLTGLSKKAIAYYEAKGLIQVGLDGSGYRDFKPDHIESLNKIGILRALGLSVEEIGELLVSNSFSEDLRKIAIKKKMDLDLEKEKLDLIKELEISGQVLDIRDRINSLQKKKYIKERLLEVFPGFYGRFFLNHFSPYLNIKIESPSQERAYREIVEFLDGLDLIKLPDEIMLELEDVMDFWTEEKLDEFEKSKLDSIKNPKDFLEKNKGIIDDYMEYKKSEAYEKSYHKELEDLMRSLVETSGYRDIFIPAMRSLSPKYDEYYKSLLDANEVFLKELEKWLAI